MTSDPARYEVIIEYRNVIATVRATVWRWRTTSRLAPATERTVNGRRLASDSVSGRRRVHTISTTAITAGNQNTARQGRNAMSPAPRAGAMMGTSMNTAMIIDIRRAMVLPSWRSRMMVTANERGPLAPTPHTKRAMMSTSQVVEVAAAMAPMA